jgi:hypothetical protein
MLEYIIIFIDSWEYPTKFLVLQTKYQFNGYPLIFGRPWMATTIYSYIDYRARNMTIIDGQSQKEYCPLSPTQPLITKNLPMWDRRRRIIPDPNYCLSYLHNHNLGQYKN